MRAKIVSGLFLAGLVILAVLGVLNWLASSHKTSTISTTIPNYPIATGFLDNYSRLPMSFEANRGQAAAPVEYLSRGSGYSLFLSPTEALLVLRQSANSPSSLAGLRMQLVNAAPAPTMIGRAELPGRISYFRGNDPARWQVNLPTYAQVQNEGVYPGIDLIYYGDQRQLEFDFIVAPGADPQAITLAFHGAEKVELDAEANLVLQVSGRQVTLRRPQVYQEVEGVRQEIPGRYILLPASADGSAQVGFQIGAYDSTRPLVIDPVLVYATYLGGGAGDSALGAAVDAAGNAYVVGSTTSLDFPTANPLQPAGGDSDAFVAKLAFDPTTSALTLMYATYLGGSGDDFGEDIAVEPSSGQAYVIGSTTSPDFPVVNALQAAGGASDAFAARLAFDPTAAPVLTLAYSTYLGGTGNDFGKGIAVDAAGQAYVTGLTVSSDFPTAFPLQGLGGGFDAFAAKLAFDPTAAPALTLGYSTYLGGSLGENSGGIAVDASGAAYLVGSTASTDFPINNALQPANGGGGDVFAAKLIFDPTASTPLSLPYATYLGGAGNDFGEGITVDASGDAFLTGSTASTNFPTLNPLQLAHGGGPNDAFAARLAFDPATSVLTFTYSTYLGGSAADIGQDVAVDASGHAYLTGLTFSSDFPTLNALQANAGASDAYVAKLIFDPAASTLAFDYSTYLGGSGSDDGKNIAVDALGSVYVAGSTFSSNFPTVNPMQSALIGAFDAFVAKIGIPPTVSAGGPYTVAEGGSIPVTAIGDSTLTFVWDLDEDGVFETPGQSATFSAAGLDGPDSRPIRVRATNSVPLATVAETTVEVLNVAPTVGPITAPIDPVTVNTPVAAQASFSDPGLPDTHTAIWDWGDGTTSVGLVAEMNGMGTTSDLHTYTGPGLYTVKATVTDDDGGVGESVFEFIVVYDPDAGFVTGGGWIESPAGAYTPASSLTGKATFGFVAKYPHGAATPRGQTEFHFQAAGLKFHSASYQWLVVAGSKVQFSGSGAINNDGDYGFLLTASDGESDGTGVDRFRFKIWDKVTGAVIYDNQMGAPDDADAVQGLTGGSLVIHP